MVRRCSHRDAARLRQITAHAHSKRPEEDGTTADNIR
jgi:hypothetical protein